MFCKHEALIILKKMESCDTAKTVERVQHLHVISHDTRYLLNEHVSLVSFNMTSLIFKKWSLQSFCKNETFSFYKHGII